ncbi:MAG TPA: APC family permease, partial [Bacillota bacterium]|nr:APC family permease [Bacillota bacterium]
GKTTGMDMFAGLVLALIVAFLTAISYAKLAEAYPEAGTGSSYYFAEQAFLNEEKFSPFARLTKFITGWFAHLYYWVYPGVLVAMMAVLINYIFSQFGVTLSPIIQILIAFAVAGLTGAVAYRGINGSTMTSIIINVIQIVSLVFITVLALVYRFTNPQQVEFVHKNLSSVILPHSFANVVFQATVAILLLVGFESATALTAEAKSTKHVSRGVILSLLIQGLIFYLFEYFGANAWINNSYKVGEMSGLAAAAASGAPIGDMVRILGDVLLGNIGFVLMITISVTVAIAVFGSILACMNTGVRVTYAMAKDKEVPSVLGMLHPKHATPHTGVWIITIISGIIGAFGVLTVTNLLAVTFLQNIGTFVVYGLTNLIALVAFLRHPKRNAVTHIIVPVLGFLTNLGMLAGIFYLGILGGGSTREAAIISIIVTLVWIVVGIFYLITNSKKLGRKVISARTNEERLSVKNPV